MRSVLVSMPFAALERPALGISLLKAALSMQGADCHIAYLNLAFAESVGVDDYDVVAKQVPYYALAGEWAFAHCLHGANPRPAGEYVNEVLRGRWRLDEDAIDCLLRVRDRAAHFISRVVSEVPWGNYEVVGFTAFSQQDIPSLALARAIRERYPKTTIVFGGGNWQADVGVELHRRFAFVDFVCSGEADLSFPQLVAELQRGDDARPDRIGGIAYRNNGATHSTGAGPTVADLDELPVPDFADYFAARHRWTRRGLPAIVMETSRGCWRVGSNRCLFCGLNGLARGYRTKSPARILSEIGDLTSRWPCSLLDIVDNVVSPTFLKNVIPALAERRLPTPIFFETRPQVTEEQVRSMRRVRARIQPGLETLSDHVLALMHKGTTVLENVRLLKWCRQHSVHVYWNMLYGFPGETDDDYRRMLELLPGLYHLEPPTNIGPLRLDRFAPYYRQARDHGFDRVRPLAAYHHLYPFSARAMRAVAYTFDYDCDRRAGSFSDGDRLRTAVEEWQRASDKAMLQLRAIPDGRALLIDARGGTVREKRVLDDLDAALCLACNDIRTVSELCAAAAAQSLPDGGPRPEGGEVAQRLSALVAQRLMITDGERYLALPTRWV